MNSTITVGQEEILHHIKTSLEIPKIIKDILKRKVVIDTAKKHGLNLDEEEVQSAADLVRVVNNINSATETWHWLDEHSLSLEEFEDAVNITLFSQKLATHLFSDKVEKHFFSQHLNYASANFYEIIFDDEDVAIDYFYSVKEGEISFFDLAHQHIKDKELRKMCGYRRSVFRRDLKPELATVIFSATEAQLFKPIKTQLGSHLILLDSVERKELDDSLRLEIVSELFDEWLEQQVKALNVVKNV